MISVIYEPNYFDEGIIASFKRDGREIAYRIIKADGTKEPIIFNPRESEPCEALTRAKGYRYWRRHFPGRACFTLPEALEEAINLPCKSYGTFFYKKHGEWWGYQG